MMGRVKDGESTKLTICNKWGDESELFGGAFTAEDVNSSEFGAVFRVQPAVDDTLVQVDCITLEVFYTISNDLGTIPGDLGNSFR